MERCQVGVHDDGESSIQWGSAARVIGLIKMAAITGPIQASELFPAVQFLAADSLWVESSPWACDSLNCTATTASPSSKPPYEMWRGSRPR